MPIKKELRHHYAADWKRIATKVKRQANWCCEKCGARHGDWVVKSGSENLPAQTLFISILTPVNPDQYESRDYYRVIVTVSHINRIAGDNRRENLWALCQRCHLVYDAQQHAENRAQTQIRKSAQAHQQAGQLNLV